MTTGDYRWASCRERDGSLLLSDRRASNLKTARAWALKETAMAIYG